MLLKIIGLILLASSAHASTIQGNLTVSGSSIAVTGGGSKFVVDNTGVSASTVNVSGSIDVEGTAQFGSSSSGFMCWKNNTRYLSVGNNSCSQNLGANDGQIVFTSTSATATWPVLSIANNNNSATLLRVQQNGNVGIGVAAPGSKLQINGTSNSPSLSANNSILSVFGTTTPGLEINGYNTSPFGMWLQATDNASASYPMYLNPLGGDLYVGVATTPVTGAYTAWTPTWTGFSTPPTVTAKYKIIGKTFRFHIERTSGGTSNNTAVTVTFPFPALYAQTSIFYGVSDNGGSIAATSPRIDVAAGSAVGNVYPDQTGGNWSNGTSFISGNGEFEIQ